MRCVVCFADVSIADPSEKGSYNSLRAVLNKLDSIADPSEKGSYNLYIFKVNPPHLGASVYSSGETTGFATVSNSGSAPKRFGPWLPGRSVNMNTAKGPT